MLENRTFATTFGVLFAISKNKILNTVILGVLLTCMSLILPILFFILPKKNSPNSMADRYIMLIASLPFFYFLFVFLFKRLPKGLETLDEELKH